MNRFISLFTSVSLFFSSVPVLANPAEQRAQLEGQKKQIVSTVVRVVKSYKTVGEFSSAILADARGLSKDDVQQLQEVRSSRALMPPVRVVNEDKIKVIIDSNYLIELTDPSDGIVSINGKQVYLNPESGFSSIVQQLESALSKKQALGSMLVHPAEAVAALVITVLVGIIAAVAAIIYVRKGGDKQEALSRAYEQVVSGIDCRSDGIFFQAKGLEISENNKPQYLFVGSGKKLIEAFEEKFAEVANPKVSRSVLGKVVPGAGDRLKQSRLKEFASQDSYEIQKGLISYVTETCTKRTMAANRTPSIMEKIKSESRLQCIEKQANGESCDAEVGGGSKIETDSNSSRAK